MAVMTSSLTAAEQYMLELINQARLDPAAEALRLNIRLNAGLALNTIDASAKQVLAPNQLLEQAATGHAQWMLATDTFSHTGANGSSPGQRATEAGYTWSTLGENIQWMGSTGAISLNTLISKQHDALFRSAPHRANLMNNDFAEIGVAQEQGLFQAGAYNFNAAMVAQSFGNSGEKFVTGVAYSDLNNDGKYSIGEGAGGVGIRVAGGSGGEETLAQAATGAAGGYAAETSAATTFLTGSTATADFGAVIDTMSGNAKLDVVNGTTLATSATAQLLNTWFSGDQVLDTDMVTLIDEMITAGAGTINNLRLLGVANLAAIGSNVANVIDGNKGNNSLDGAEGNDTVNGNAGADTVMGGDGADSLHGGSGNDQLFGGAGADNLNGFFGLDRISGGAGSDLLRGGLDKDTFIFNAGDGADFVLDFSTRARERLELDDALWANDLGEPVALTKAQVVSTYAHVVLGKVVFDFGDGDVLTLSSVRSLWGLSGLIDII